MTPEEVKVLGEVDDSLAVGMEVRVYWTSRGRYCSALGRLVKVNEKSVKVETTEQGKSGYPIGSVITVPRFADIKNWSAGNCVTLPGGAAAMIELARSAVTQSKE